MYFDLTNHNEQDIITFKIKLKLAVVKIEKLDWKTTREKE